MREGTKRSKQPTSAVSQTDLGTLDAMQDEDIDLSRCRSHGGADGPSRAACTVGALCHAEQRRVNMFLDAFIIEYFKAKPVSVATNADERRPCGVHPHHDLEDTMRRVIREELSPLSERGNASNAIDLVRYTGAEARKRGDRIFAHTCRTRAAGDGTLASAHTSLPLCPAPEAWR